MDQSKGLLSLAGSAEGRALEGDKGGEEGWPIGRAGGAGEGGKGEAKLGGRCSVHGCVTSQTEVSVPGLALSFPQFPYRLVEQH